MPLSRQFVHVVGKAPFTGKHQMQYSYREGVRAALTGGSEERDRHLATIRRYQRVNRTLAFAGLFCSAFSLVVKEVTLRPGTPLLNAIEMACIGIGLAFAAGHGSASAAEKVMADRLEQVPVREDERQEQDVGEQPGDSHTEQPFPDPSLWEKVVTYGGKGAVMAAIAIQPGVTILGFADQLS